MQRAISAQQVFREKKESMVIPVPEAESNVNYYNRLYKGEFKQPKQFIHIQRKLTNVGFVPPPPLFKLCSCQDNLEDKVATIFTEWDNSKIQGGFLYVNSGVSFKVLEEFKVERKCEVFFCFICS